MPYLPYQPPSSRGSGDSEPDNADLKDAELVAPEPSDVEHAVEEPLLTKVGRRRRTGLIMLFPLWLIARLKATGQFPNALTMSRVILFWVPAWFILVHPHDLTGFIGALVSFALISLTDLIDGKLARRWKQVSKFGKIWDPLADKLLIGTIVLILCFVGILLAPWGWIFAGITISREILVSLLRWLKERGGRNLVIPANMDGKIKMNLQVVGVIFSLLAMLVPALIYVAWAAFIVSLYFSLKSAVAYVKA